MRCWRREELRQEVGVEVVRRSLGGSATGLVDGLEARARGVGIVLRLAPLQDVLSPLSELVVQYPRPSRHLIRPSPQSARPLLQDVQRRQLSRLILLQRML